MTWYKETLHITNNSYDFINYMRGASPESIIFTVSLRLVRGKLAKLGYWFVIVEKDSMKKTGNSKEM